MSASISSILSGTTNIGVGTADPLLYGRDITNTNRNDSDGLKSASLLNKAADKTANKAEDAARQFESLLIAQMLKSERESSGGAGVAGLDGNASGDEADSETSLMLDLADQQFAKMLAQEGGLGLTHLLVNGMKGP